MKGTRPLSTVLGLLRFRAGLERYLRHEVSTAEARAVVQERLRTREERFLRMLQHAVFGHRRSPYLALCRAAGCELGDVAALVRREGVEGALQSLLRAGIHVTLDELKGRQPAVRGGRTFRFRPEDFDNPLVRIHYATPSGGSRGRPSRILIDLDYLAARAPVWRLWFAAHDLDAARLVLLRPVYPGLVNLQLVCAKAGQRFVRWFATGSGGSLAYRLVTAYVHALARTAAGFPRPEFVTAAGFSRIGEALTGLIEAGERPCVIASPTDAIRVCQAVRERGGSLGGLTFLLGYEPLDATRRSMIEATGASVAVTYGFSEGGTLGQQCRWPAEPDEVHVADDAFAVLLQRDERDQNEAEGALIVTALSATSPKVLLNAAIGDRGVLETRRCECVFDELGYHRRLHTIRSAEKLTGAGVTFLVADVAAVLETVLPRAFGGTFADYQLIEMQDGQGLPRYQLRVSPAVGVVHEVAVVTTFLRALGSLRKPYGFMANQWAEAGLVEVVRRAPVPTGRGKLLPVRTAVTE